VNNPVGRTDPTGECPECIAALIGAGAGFAVGYGVCVASGGGWWSANCWTQGGEGALTGAIAGATFGLSLGALGVGEGVAATVGQTLLAGAVSGTISGLYSFDISVFSGKRPTLSDLETDLGFGLVTGVIGAGISYILPGGATIGPSVSDLENEGSTALNNAGIDTTKIPKFAVIVIGGGVELGKAFTGAVVDPLIHGAYNWLGTQPILTAPGWVYYPTPAYGKDRANPT